MKLFATNKRKLIAFATLALLGVGILFGAQILREWTSPQVTAYNRGTALYEQALTTGDPEAVEKAVKSFDQSLDAYRRAQNPGWLESKFLPPPSTEYAAMAHAKKAILMLLLQKPDLAVREFKESLKLNTGDSYQGVTSAEANRLREQAYEVKYNLELLFKKNPSQAQKEGKGQGKPGDKPGQKPQPGNDPGKMPGKGNRDDI